MKLLGHMETVRTEQLSKRLANGYPLGPLEFRVGQGEVLGVIGPRGSGKTTLLRLIWGFMKPDKGSICVFGLSPHLDQIKVRLRTGYVSASPQFYAGPTVKQALQFAAHFYEGWNAERSYRVLADFGIHPDAEIESLSKGDRIKVALASATGHRPSLLLLDEPASGLDQASRSDILRFIQHLSRREHVSILFSAEAAVDLGPAADRALMLNESRAGTSPATLPGKA